MDSRKAVIYKVVRRDGDILKSVVARGPLEIVYPVGKWVENPTPMMCFLDVEDSYTFLNDFVYGDFEVWLGECIDPFIISRILQLHRISQVDWRWLTEYFWDSRVFFNVQALIGNLICPAPQATYGTRKLILERRVG